MERETSWIPPNGPAAAPAPTPGPVPPAPPRSGLRRVLGPLAVIGAIAIKVAGKLKALLLLAPKLKLLTTASSMVVSVAAYALIWGWKFAAGFVALLFLHEMGHAIQMRREGVQPSWMFFIPFMGAAVGARSMGGNALAEARIGLAGPVLGSLAAAGVAGIAVATGDDFWRALAFTGFFLNLFNMLPVTPLDGGRAMAAMAPWMWFVGFGVVVTLCFVAPNPVLILIALLAGMDLYRRWKQRRKGEEGNRDYYRVRPLHRLLVGAVYVGLIVGLALGMNAMFVDRSSHF